LLRPGLVGLGFVVLCASMLIVIVWVFLSFLRLGYHGGHSVDVLIVVMRWIMLRSRADHERTRLCAGAQIPIDISRACF
jgi:hypothetical protein